MPLRPRHGYDADFHRGLPVGDIDRPRSSRRIASRVGARRHPAHIRQVRAGGPLKGRLTLVSSVHLPVSLAEPRTSDSAGLSRLCQGCLPPSPASPGVGLPSATSVRYVGLAAVPFHHRTVNQRLAALDVPRPDRFKGEGFNGGLEFVSRTNQQAVGDDVKIAGVSAFGSLPLGESLKGYARVDAISNDAKDTTDLLLIAGLDHRPADMVRLFRRTPGRMAPDSMKSRWHNLFVGF